MTALRALAVRGSRASLLGALAFVASSAFVLGCPPSEAPPSGPPAGRYAGVEVCRECHPTAWKVWLESRHSRASVTLQTALARDIAPRMGREPCCLTDDLSCLRCHGTGVFPEGRVGRHGENSRPEEGVTCEACHGPAEEHVARARRETPRPRLVSSLQHPVRACESCHEPKKSHEHELARPFDRKRFGEHIAHGVESPPAVDWLRPGGRATLPGAQR